MKVLDLQQIRELVPSAFATASHAKMREKYQFYPTSAVIDALMQANFLPVYARQTRCRDLERRAFTRHVLRFRHNDYAGGNVGDEIPEIILRNAHDGTSSYQIGLGFFRLICGNGLAVKTHDVLEMRIRHYGAKNLLDDVIEGSFKVMEQTPVVLDKIEQYKAIELSPSQQVEFAINAIESRNITLDVDAREFLQARRASEMVKSDGSRDLWTTFNVVQENLIRGGIRGTNAKGKTRTLREVKAADADLRINRELWELLDHSANNFMQRAA